MRVLHLTPELPYWPGGSGGATRQFHLLRRLVELGHEVTVVAPATVEQLPRISDLEAAGIRPIVYERPLSRVIETLEALRQRPALAAQALSRPVLAWQVSVFWHHMRGLAVGAAADRAPDAISVEHDQAAAWLGDLPAESKAILTLQNLGWRYYESRAAAAPRLWRRALAVEGRRFARFDRRHLPRFDGLVAVSSEDAAALAPFDVPVELVPNGVSTTELHAQPPAGRDVASVLFTGTMAYPPNAEGIGWFVREVWPLVRSERPDATLTIVGRDPPPSVRRLADDDAITVTGTVPDVKPYFAQASVAVAPVLSGGGTRLKLLEAWSACRAVVATSQAAAGLEYEPGRHLLVEDDPRRFAEAVLVALRDPQLRERLAREGRALVEQSYDWASLGERFEGFLRSVVGRP